VVAILALALGALVGCGLSAWLEIERLKWVNPDWVGSVEALGLTELVPAEELGFCGPNGELSDIIPDCPMPGVCFAAACAAHDICYSTCGTQQADCDDTFLWDMVYLCDSSDLSFWDHTRCYNIAWIYYDAVRDLGASFFEVTQQIVCERAESAGGVSGDAAGERSGRGIPAFFVDADGDSMPDEWELEVYLDPTDPADAWVDYDGDGRVNLAEYTHGSDPYVP
jgi:hypothetical protein